MYKWLNCLYANSNEKIAFEERFLNADTSNYTYELATFKTFKSANKFVADNKEQNQI
jgi:hypothetical protein